MGFINFNKANPYKLVSNNPYTTFKPAKEDKANGIQD